MNQRNAQLQKRPGFKADRPARDFADRLAQEHGVLCGSTASHRIRMVTHLDIDAAAITHAIAAVRAVGAEAGD